MQGILNETSQKSKSKATGSSSTVHILDDDDEDEDDLEKRNVKGRSSNEGKRKATTNLHPFFTKVDASSIENNATNLCNLFAEIVEMVGEKNVVQIVTDNAANYKLAGTMLCERYRTITWSPCAAHCLNLVLKDVSELDNVKSLVTLASRVTVFVYNHKWPLNWLRKRQGWTEIVRPGTTRFDGWKSQNTTKDVYLDIYKSKFTECESQSGKTGEETFPFSFLGSQSVPNQDFGRDTNRLDYFSVRPFDVFGGDDHLTINATYGDGGAGRDHGVVVDSRLDEQSSVSTSAGGGDRTQHNQPDEEEVVQRVEQGRRGNDGASGGAGGEDRGGVVVVGW